MSVASMLGYRWLGDLVNLAMRNCNIPCCFTSYVTTGKESMARGSAAYKPTYILDAVLLSDRIKTLEDMGDAISECPG